MHYLIVALLFFVSNNGVAWAGQATPERAQQIINDCLEISRESRESIHIDEMRVGNLENTLCLEKHIIQITETEMFQNQPEVVEETKKQLEDIRNSAGNLYWNIFNNGDHCLLDTSNQPCGIGKQPIHNYMVGTIMKNILINIIGELDEQR
mgnify:CR=1 FL=1